MISSFRPRRSSLFLSPRLVSFSRQQHHHRLRSSMMSTSTTTATTTTTTLGILRETYNPWERRTPLTPEHVHHLLRVACPSSIQNIVVQPSSTRIFSDQEYRQAGAIVTHDLSSADILFGVKQPDKSLLLPNKTYVFFSHTIKGQQENMPTLQRCLGQEIQLFDYECMRTGTNDSVSSPHRPTTKRLVSFGRFAGMAGAIDSFSALGKRLLYTHHTSTPFLNCPMAWMNDSLQNAQDHVLRIRDQLLLHGGMMVPEPIVVAVSGKGGAVHNGAMEILTLLPHEIIAVDDLPTLFHHHDHQQHKGGLAENHRHDKIYLCPVGLSDIMQHCDGAAWDRSDFGKHPAHYRCLFGQKVAPYCTALLNCVYWDARFPRLLTKGQMRRLYEHHQTRRLLLVTDISCDVNGSIELLERSTTIEKPFFQYDPIMEREIVDEIADYGVTVMGVDNLPAELPRESSEHFSQAVVDVVKEMVDVREHQAMDTPGVDCDLLAPHLADACITTTDGRLTRKYRYLEPLMKRTSSAIADPTNKSMLLSLEGHLFDSGLINQVLDVIERQEGGLEFEQCRFPPHSATERMMSSVLLRIVARDEATLKSIESKIEALVDAISKAEATMNRVDRRGSAGTSGLCVHVEGPKLEKRVLLLGAGRVSKSLVDLLGRSRDVKITVASERGDEASQIASLAAKGQHVALDVANDVHHLSRLIEDTELVISLLPAPMHPRVAQECIMHKKDLLTASYESDEMRDMHHRARDAGIIVLNEVGLDPGLDHMSAMKIIDDIKARGGFVTLFSSVCGGLPAEATNNPFMYKFSWNPHGVISACQNDARYRWKGRIMEIHGRELLQSAAPFVEAWPGLGLECLPNRDALVYEKTYGIEDADTIFRGTLRYRGFSALMNAFQNMGLFGSVSVKHETWPEVINMLRMQRGGFESLRDFIEACADEDVDVASRAMETLEWLGIMGDDKTVMNNQQAHVVEAFCRVLSEKLSYDHGEQDMVVMHHTIEASFDDGSEERHLSTLQVFGDSSASAMSKTVGYTTAAAAELILKGSLGQERGLLLPTDARIYRPVLARVGQEGIVFEENLSVHAPSRRMKVTA